MSPRQPWTLLGVEHRCPGIRFAKSSLLAILTLVWLSLGWLVGAVAGLSSTLEPLTLEEEVDHYNKTSELMKNLLKNYDIRLRPGFGGPALTLDLDIYIASFDKVSEVDMDYTITIYLHQHWRDGRLGWSNFNNESMTLSGDFSDRIWVPDTFLANDKQSYLHQVTEVNKMLRLHADGSIAYGMRFTTTLACNMDLRYYPLDSQECTVEIESYGYTMDDVRMRWKDGENSVRGVFNVSIPQFEVIKYLTNDTIATTSTGDYQRLSLKFTLRRHIGYFIFQTYLPCILIVMLSWVSFWINHEATSARVALGITTVLTMTTISTGVRASLPRISYIKAIDIYLVMCFVFVFAALLEYAAVNYSYWGSRAKKKAKPKRSTSMIGNETENWDEMSNENAEGDTKQFQFSQALAGGSAAEDTELTELNRVTSSSYRRPSLARMSPIPSLRHTAGFLEMNAVDASSPELPRTRPSTHHRQSGFSLAGTGNSYSTVRLRQRSRGLSMGTHVAAIRRRGRVLQSLKARAKAVKTALPRIKDINLIDKYARIAFPSCFVLFNVGYWCYYSFMEQEGISK